MLISKKCEEYIFLKFNVSLTELPVRASSRSQIPLAFAFECTRPTLRNCTTTTTCIMRATWCNSAARVAVEAERIKTRHFQEIRRAHAYILRR